MESALRKSGIQEGMILVSAMHITAGVCVNDAEDGLIADIDEWLEKLAPFRRDYRHHRTGETNGDSHLKSLLVHHEVIVPVTGGQAGLRPLAAGLLRRIRRPAVQTRDHQSDGRVKGNAARRHFRRRRCNSMIRTGIVLPLMARRRRSRRTCPSGRWCSTSTASATSSAAGESAPGESARLDFKASEMNDVLKSLTIEDKGGGKIAGLRYDSSEPLAQKLAEFPFQLGRGAAAERGARPAQGRAHGAASSAPKRSRARSSGARVVAGGEQRPSASRSRCCSMRANCEPSTSPRRCGMRFPDPKLQTQFKEYLAALAGARSQGEAQRLHRFDRRAGRARSSAGYMIPTPVWKSSYRLIFGAKRAADARGLGHRGQHHRRGLDQRAAVAGFRAADFVHQPAV